MSRVDRRAAARPAGPFSQSIGVDASASVPTVTRSSAFCTPSSASDYNRMACSDCNMGMAGGSSAAVITSRGTVAVSRAGRGVRVNALCPGWFPSEMTRPVLRSAPVLGAHRGHDPDGAGRWRTVIDAWRRPVHSNEMHAAMEQVAGEYVTPITTTA